MRCWPPAEDQGQQAHEPGPQQQRAGLPDPQRGQRVVPGQEFAGVLRNVGKREILAVQGPGQDARPRRSSPGRSSRPPTNRRAARADAAAPRRPGRRRRKSRSPRRRPGDRSHPGFSWASLRLLRLVLAGTPSQELVAAQLATRLQASFDNNIDALGQIIRQRSRANHIQLAGRTLQAEACLRPIARDLQRSRQPHHH